MDRSGVLIPVVGVLITVKKNDKFGNRSDYVQITFKLRSNYVRLRSEMCKNYVNFTQK